MNNQLTRFCLTLDMPNVKAWGSKAKKYFGTDYIDKDGAGITDKDRRIAEAEEEEGIAAQRRLIDELNESAFDFDCFQTAGENEKEKLDLDDDDTELENLDSLSDKEKEDFLRRQSPEFFIFKQDYERYLEESRTKLSQIIDLCEDAKYAAFKANDLYKFIVAKNGLIQRYCANIAFYMLLKTKGINVKSHPIRSTLNLYRKLVKQTDEYLESIGLSDLDRITDKLKSEDNGDFFANNDLNDKRNDEQANKNKKRKNQTVKKAAKKKVKFADEIDSADELPLSKQLSKSIGEQSTNDPRHPNDKDELEEPDKEFYSDEEQDEKEVLFVHRSDDVKKRRISKMIEKNKGLTPYRKRDYRNPRVRYKGKYIKAEIKRKSQVKEPVKEIKKYAGEYHGIKTSVVRSVRFK